MLENYYPSGLGSKPVSDEQKRRIVAVGAALELVKASLSSGGHASTETTEQDIKAAINLISPLADAIQAAIAI